MLKVLIPKYNIKKDVQKTRNHSTLSGTPFFKHTHTRQRITAQPRIVKKIVKNTEKLFKFLQQTFLRMRNI